jgi:hypothetical protein
MQCFGCGVEKDTEKPERYAGNLDIRKDKDVEPLLVLDVEPWGEDPEPWRAAVVCHSCFDRLEPDMWISSNCWHSIGPALEFRGLPELLSEAHKSEDPAAHYAHVKVPSSVAP